MFLTCCLRGLDRLQLAANPAPHALNMSKADKAMLDHIKRFIAMCLRGGVAPKPKLHLFLELGVRAFAEGHPSAYATWRDEGMNRVLAEIGRCSHRMVWYVRVLHNWESSAPGQQRKRARR